MTPKILHINSLKWRITLSYPLFGTVLGLAMLLLLYASLDWQERALMDHYIERELAHFQASTHQDPDLVTRSTSRWQAYVTELGRAPESWPQTRDLAPGIHEVTQDGNEFDLGIAEHAGRRYTLIINDTEEEEREHNLLRILLVISLLSLLLAAWLGLLIARRVVNPIIELTGFVEDLDHTQPCVIHEPPQALRTAQDETGLLARRFEDYQRQLCDFIQREQSFTGDASHELRTPLAVVSAATETLLLRSRDDEAAQQGLLRIQRAVEEMENTLELLLGLARETLDPDRLSQQGNVDLESLLSALIQQEISHRGLPDQAIKRDFKATPTVKAGDESVRLILRNLIDNALEHGQKSVKAHSADSENRAEVQVMVSLQERSVCIEDAGPGIKEADLPTLSLRGRRLNQNASDRAGHSGLGLAIVERLCAFHGWTLTFERSSQGGLRVVWSF